MDRYFYSIEEYGNEKIIYITGNVYFNDADESETDHRIAEWTGLDLTVAKVKQLIEEDDFFDYINEKVNYLDDVTKEEALDACNTYWNGESGVELDIRTITEDTPCGYYWFDV